MWLANLGFRTWNRAVEESRRHGCQGRSVEPHVGIWGSEPEEINVTIYLFFSSKIKRIHILWLKRNVLKFKKKYLKHERKDNENTESLTSRPMRLPLHFPRFRRNDGCPLNTTDLFRGLHPIRDRFFLNKSEFILVKIASRSSSLETTKSSLLAALCCDCETSHNCWLFSGNCAPYHECEDKLLLAGI